MLRAAIAGAVAAGIGLRGWRLGRQILSGDEFHAVNAALEWPLGEILTTWTYHGADYGVPLGALLRLAFDAGLSLGELELRLPAFVCGTALVAVAPWLLRDRIGPRATAVLAWLVATSPLLAIYSRMVRTYAPAGLLAFVAAVGFERWWRTGSRRAGVAYAVCAPLALWSNLSVAPFVAAPVVYGAIRTALGERERLRGLATIGGAALAGVAVLLLPARSSFETLGEVHGRGGIPDATTWLEVVRMHAGSANVALAALVVAATLRGGWLAWHRERDFLLYALSLVVLHVAGLVAIGPDQLDNPIVINRYLLVVLPFGLAFAAVGLAEPLPRIGPRAQLGLVGALLVAIVATGPFASATFRHTSFATASTFAYFVRDGNTIARGDMPAFYQTLVDDPGERAVIEYPWSNLATHAVDAYQKHHGRPVVMAAPWKSLDDERLRLRQTVPARVGHYLESEARWLVVHLNLQREERRIRTSDRNHWMRLEDRPEIWRPLLRAGPKTVRSFERRYGEADHRDDEVAVWDLDRLRELH